MAHRQLAEDYKLKLKDANDRIFELESAMADQAYELEQLKKTPGAHSSAEQLETAHARITELEQMVKVQEDRLKRASEAKGGLVESDLQQELEAVLSRNQELEQQLSERDDDEAVCMDVDAVAAAADGASDTELSALREQVEVLTTHAASLEAQLTESKTAMAAMDAGPLVASLRSQVLGLTNQLETYKTAESALRDQLAKTGGKDAADAVYNDALKSQIRDHTATQFALQITANNVRERADKAVKKFEKSESRLEDRDRYLEKLKAQLAREKEARIAAESKKSACSSKVCQFCKTCNPIRIDLCRDEDDEEDFKKLNTKAAPLPNVPGFPGMLSAFASRPSPGSF
ncbi:hypothetical protein LTR85_008082 [Meristemomyces frigidus]|nr:hypothetical protein LTR85_008082 [Meristemomyces frigidus]